MTRCRASESTLSTYRVVTQYRVRFVCIAKDSSQSSHPRWTNVSSRIFLWIQSWRKLRILPVRLSFSKNCSRQSAIRRAECVALFVTFRCFKSSCSYCLFSSLETVLIILQVRIMIITQSRPSEFKTNHRFEVTQKVFVLVERSAVCWVTRQISCVRVDGTQNGKITFHTNQKRGEKKTLTHRVFIWRQKQQT